MVLGCTHYPLTRDVIQAALPDVAIFDGGEGTARQTQRRLTELGLLNDGTSSGYIRFFNSKNDVKIIELS